MLQFKETKKCLIKHFFTMDGSEGLGLPLVKKGDFAADFLVFGPNQKTILHTHEGDHILIVAEGSGFLQYAGEVRPLHAGDCYLVEGLIPHLIEAGLNGLGLFAVSNKHYSVNSSDRMVPHNA